MNFVPGKVWQAAGTHLTPPVLAHVFESGSWQDTEQENHKSSEANLGARTCTCQVGLCWPETRTRNASNLGVPALWRPTSICRSCNRFLHSCSILRAQSSEKRNVASVFPLAGICASSPSLWCSMSAFTVAARANPKPEHLELSRDCDLQSLSSPGPRLLQLVKVVLFYEGLDIATPSTHAGSVCRPCGSRFKGFPRERTSRRSSRWTTCGAGGMAGLSRFVEQAQLVTAVLSWLHGVAV